MAISRLMGSDRHGQVLQARDLAVDNLELVLSGSLIASGAGFAEIVAAPLKTQQAAFGARISTEYSRALAAEGVIQAALDVQEAKEAAYETSNNAALATEVAANNTDHGSATTDRALIRTQYIAADAVVSTAFAAADATVLSTARGDAALAYNNMGKLEDKIQVEEARVDAILLSAGASTDTFAEIVTLINSVDTANDNAFAAHVATYNAYVTSNNAALATEVAANNTDHGSATTDRALIRTQYIAADAVVSTAFAAADATVLSTARGDAALAYNNMGKLEDKIQVEEARVDAILLSAGASTDTFAEIVTLINSVDTANDNAFAAHVATYNAYVTSNNAALATEVAANNTDHTAATTDRAAVRTEFAAADSGLSTRIGTLESFDGRVADAFTVSSASAGCILAFGSKAPQLKLVPDGAFVKVEVSYKA